MPKGPWTRFDSPLGKCVKCRLYERLQFNAFVELVFCKELGWFVRAGTMDGATNFSQSISRDWARDIYRSFK